MFSILFLLQTELDPPLRLLLCRNLNAQENYTELPRNVRTVAFLEKKVRMAAMTASL